MFIRNVLEITKSEIMQNLKRFVLLCLVMIAMKLLGFEYLTLIIEFVFCIYLLCELISHKEKDSTKVEFKDKILLYMKVYFTFLAVRIL